jgi:hypothetical protein
MVVVVKEITAQDCRRSRPGGCDAGVGAAGSLKAKTSAAWAGTLVTVIDQVLLRGLGANMGINVADGKVVFGQEKGWCLRRKGTTAADWLLC